MGVSGLQGFVEKNCRDAFVDVDVVELASTYRQTTGKDAVLVFDLASCLFHIYTKCQGSFLCGGQLKQYIELFSSFLRKIENAGIHCVFFSDCAPPTQRLPLWVSRKENEFQRVDKVLSVLADGAVEEAEQLAKEMRPPQLWTALLAYLQHHKVKLIQTEKEADEEIMEYFANNDCLGIVSQDSDFIICEGIRNYLSIQHFNLETLTTKAYRGAALANYFSFDAKFLPLLASMSGNDIVDKDALRSYHLSLLRNERNSQKFTHMKFLPRYLLLPRIADWIRRNIKLGMNVEDIAMKASRAAHLPELSDLFATSMNSYKLPEISKKVQDKEPMKGHYSENWDSVLESVRILTREQHMPHMILSVVTRSAAFDGVYLQFYTKPGYPPGSVVLRPIRQRLYGILLRERPSGVGTAKVDEYIFCGDGPRDKMPIAVDPIYPDDSIDHPGLVKLWTDETTAVENKWLLLCWAVNPAFCVQDVLKVAPPLRVPALALRYLVNDVKVQLKKWEVEALASHVVNLMSLDTAKLRRIQMEAIDKYAVHWGNVYQSACQIIYIAAAACGYPTSLHHFPDFMFYDGELFHQTYATLKNGDRVNFGKSHFEYQSLIDFVYLK